jgi:hypothetical protein
MDHDETTELAAALVAWARAQAERYAASHPE